MSDSMTPDSGSGGERNELADLLAPLWTRRRVRNTLKLTDSEIGSEQAAGRLLGVTTTDGDTLFPLFQFESDRGAVRVRPSLVPFPQRLRDRDPWTVGVLVLTSADELGGCTPLDWIRERGDEAVLVAYAEVLDSEFNRRCAATAACTALRRRKSTHVHSTPSSAQTAKPGRTESLAGAAVCASIRLCGIKQCTPGMTAAT